MLTGPAIGSERLMALIDGVTAVVLTIMVLEPKPPHGADAASLKVLWPTFLSFALSFVYAATYWNNHHFLWLVRHVGAVLRVNLDLLFWLSPIPFTTAWLDEHGGAPLPLAPYGLVLLLCALSWIALQSAIVQMQGGASPLAGALGRDWWGKLSPLGYLAGALMAFVAPAVSYAIYAALALAWLVPNQRMQAYLAGEERRSSQHRS